MTGRPLGPLERHCVSSLDLDVGLGRHGRPVANDVRAAKGVREDEAIIPLIDGPSKHIGGVGLSGESRAIIAFVANTVDNDIADVAVGVDTDGRGERSQHSGLASIRFGEDRHDGRNGK